MRPNPTPYTDTQDFHVFLDEYRARHGEDVWSPDAPSVDGQDVAALVSSLADRGRDPIIYLPAVQGIRTPLVTNVFASRQRIARILGTTPDGLHEAYQHCTNNPLNPVYREDGPITGLVTEGARVDLDDMPMIQHFATDRGPYLTNAIIIATDPVTGVSNLSYHRSMRHARDALATSLHSRGHLWRMYQTAKEAGRALPVAMVVGAHQRRLGLSVRCAPARTAARPEHRKPPGHQPLGAAHHGARDRPQAGRRAGARWARLPRAARRALSAAPPRSP